MLRFRFLCCVLFFAAPALLGGCFFPRIDLPSTPDPHSWYQDVPLAGGAKVRFGMESTEADYRPCVMRVAPDGKPVWQKSFKRFGEGGHGIFTAGAVLRDGTILAAAAESTQTTFAVVAFAPDGRVQWGREYALPVQATGNAAILATEDGAIVTVPLSGRGELPRVYVARIDAAGAAKWAVAPSGIATVTKTLWTAGVGVTLFAPASAKPEGAQILVRLGPDGDLRWMVQIDQPPRRLWYSTFVGVASDGGVFVAGSSGDCPACQNTDVVLARFDGAGAPRWGLTVHRPFPPRRNEEERQTYRTHLSAMLETATFREDGSAVLALTFPGISPEKSPIALLDVAEDGRVRSQRAIDAWTATFTSIEVRGPDIVLEGAVLDRCVLHPPPQKSPGCGTQEWNPSLPWEPLKLDVSPFQPSVHHPALKTTDLGKELSATEKTDH